MSDLLRSLKYSELIALLDLESPSCSYCSAKDIARQGQQHIECLAVIFSGSQNRGVSYCEDCRNPFKIIIGESGFKGASPKVSWKENWRSHFPTMAELEDILEIPKYLFSRGFIKKTTGSAKATPCSSSNSSISATTTSKDAGRSNSSSIPDRASVSSYRDQWDDDYTGGTGVLDLDVSPMRYLSTSRSPERYLSTSRSLFSSGDPTENYIIDRISEMNRGYCSLLVPGSSPFDIEFNLDETCAAAKKFESLPGTHRWMLYKDIVKGHLVIERGTYVSVT